jgi:hypothetical protein
MGFSESGGHFRRSALGGPTQVVPRRTGVLHGTNLRVWRGFVRRHQPKGRSPGLLQELPEPDAKLSLIATGRKLGWRDSEWGSVCAIAIASRGGLSRTRRVESLRKRSSYSTALRAVENSSSNTTVRTVSTLSPGASGRGRCAWLWAGRPIPPPSFSEGRRSRLVSAHDIAVT